MKKEREEHGGCLTVVMCLFLAVVVVGCVIFIKGG